ncbi:MAG: hypothetical protein ACP5QG_06480 [candidate division WOR-3 bacterium]
MRRFWFLLAVAGAACSPKDEPTDPIQYFNLAEGNWWKYETVKGFGLDDSTWTLDSVTETYHETLTITNETDGVYTWVITYESDTFADTMQALIIGDTLMLSVIKTFTNPMDSTDTITVSDTVPYALCPLVVGMVWGSPEKFVMAVDLDGDFLEDSVYYRLEATVEAQEDIVTPYGNFNAFRVSYKHKFRIDFTASPPMTVELPQRIWWAPEAGPVRWIDKDYRDEANPLFAPWLVKNLSDMGGTQ